MRTHLLFFILLLAASVACKKKEDEIQGPPLTASQRALVEELNGLAIPISNNPLQLTDEQLTFLSAFADTRVVGLGEATHGSKEFFEAKHRIFQYLVEKFNHRAFGFECDFAESLFFDAYVTTGQGNLDQLMRSKMHFWTWKTKEVRALLEWMKQYNAGKSSGEQLHFYGFDCQYMDQQAEFLVPYLSKTDPEFYNRFKDLLTVLTTVTFGTNITSYQAFQDSLTIMQDYLQTNQGLFVQRSSEPEWQIARQLITTMQQTLHVIDANNRKDYSINWRDKYMADNVKWISDFMGQGSKISAWAHNYHIGSYTNNNSAYNSTGFYLQSLFGASYQKVGFAFSTGSFNAIPTGPAGNNGNLGLQTIRQPPIESSISLLFHNAQPNDFAFHLQDLPAGSGWPAFLAGNNSMLSVGAVYNGKAVDYYQFLRIGQTFDWLIYFDKVRASEQL